MDAVRYSAAFQLLVRLLFRVNVRDTQVGAKLFRREMIDTVAPLLLVKRWAFDLEVLAVGAEFGFDRIHIRIHIRHHYVRRFAALQHQRPYQAIVARRPVA